MGKTYKRDPGRSVRKKLPKSGSKTDKKRTGTNKSDAVPKRPRSGAEHVPSVNKSRRRSNRCVPTIEKKTAKRVVLSGRQSPFCTAFEMFKSERQQHKKKKGTHETDVVLKIPKFNAEPSPSGDKERRMVTRPAARKIRTRGLVCVPDDGFFMVGAGWQKPWDEKDKKTIGTSDAHPDEPRSAVQPVPADEMPDGVDQPAGLPDPNYRSLEQKLS